MNGFANIALAEQRRSDLVSTAQQIHRGRRSARTPVGSSPADAGAAVSRRSWRRPTAARQPVGDTYADAA
jgi:hypothetical protein